MESKLNKICVIFAVILTVFIGIFMYQQRKLDQKESAQYAAYTKEVTPYYIQQKELQAELNNLNSDYLKQTKANGTVSLMFTTLDSIIYEDIWPVMKAKKMTGTLLLSTKQLPGKSDCISFKKFKEMLDDGWDYCLGWDGKEDLSKWLEEMKSTLKKMNLSMPKTIYFQNKDYKGNYDEILSKFKIQTAIHHGEEAQNIIATEFIKDTIWKPGSLAFQLVNEGNYIEETILKTGSIVLTIGSGSKEEFYSRDAFTSLINRLVNWQKDNNLQVESISDACKYRADFAKEKEKLEKELEKKKNDLQKQIDELEEKIKEVSNQYF